MAYADSFSNSFGERAINSILDLESKGGFKQESLSKAFPKVDQTLENIYKNGAQGFDSIESLGISNQTDLQNAAENLTGTGALAEGGGEGGGWTFITAPEDVSWDVANSVNRVEMFGTNNPPVVSGSRGMRDLTLSNSLVEGFVRGVSLEGKVSSLEKLMDYGLNTSDGFVSVPAYQVWANNKSYGGSNAYYVIKDVKVKEAMRDLQGNTTRAYVDVSLMQVPAYQVNSGRDQANPKTSAAGAAVKQQFEDVKGQADQKIPGPGSSTAAGAADAKPAAGAGAGNDTGAGNGPGTIDLTGRNRGISLPSLQQ